MRSVNLIPRHVVQLSDWQSHLEGKFSSVWLVHSEILAQGEGHAKGTLNELGIEDGEDHVVASDRPTTIREYEPEEVEVLREVVGKPEQFFAVDYTDEGLLRRVLAVLLQQEGKGRIVVEDEQGNLVLLEDFLEADEEC